MKRTEIVNRISDVIHRTIPDAEAILYGSEARGDATPQSDIDLLILVDKEKLSVSEEEQITMPLYLIELDTGIEIHPIVMMKKNWENRPIKTPFYINVLNEGVRI